MRAGVLAWAAGLAFATLVVARPAAAEGTLADPIQPATGDGVRADRRVLDAVPGLPPVEGDPANAVILIFNHGTRRPQYPHECDRRQDVPDVVARLDRERDWQVVYLCSRATDGGQAGSYTFKRAQEIRRAVLHYRGQGVPRRRIFLLGHSAGGWSSLIAARQFNDEFNAVIAFAPAFAGPRHEESLYPWWRRRIRPQQVAFLTQARRIDALVFAYPNDQYNRPRDLRFLDRIPGVEMRTVTSCLGGHRTTYRDCFAEAALGRIRSFIQSRLTSRYSR